MTGNNEQIDADILQCKDDILRARGIIPPLAGEEEKPAKKVSAISEEQVKSPREDTGSIPIETIHPGEKPAESAGAQQEKTEIPRFDLAEEIMAEQRKITAIRRKGPGEKIEAQNQEPEVESIGYTIGQPVPAQPEQERIITEIVARDIERLCRGD